MYCSIRCPWNHLWITYNWNTFPTLFLFPPFFEGLFVQCYACSNDLREEMDKISWAILQIRAKSLWETEQKLFVFTVVKGAHGTTSTISIYTYILFMLLPIILLLVSLKQERERTMTLALCSKVTVPAVYFWKKDRKKEHKIYFLHFSTMMMKSCSIAWAGDATTTGQTNLWYFLRFKICSASLYLICSLATY